MADKWQEVELSDLHNFDTEGALIGTFNGFEDKVGPNESKLYHFKRDDGKDVSVWGSAVIDSRFSKIAVGSRVKIDFTGKKTNPKTQRTFNEFKVFVAD